MNVIVFYASTNLGNWLFQIAFARMLGDAPIAFYVSSETDLARARAFQSIYPEVTCVDTLPEGLVRYTDADFLAAGQALPEKRDGLLLDGFFQFAQVLDRDVIRRTFSCPAEVKKTIFERYASTLNQGTTVGISVRRGDYLGLPHRHPFVGETYLRQAVESFDSTACYIVCSDDIPWCKRFFSAKRFPGRTFVFIEGESVLTQLYIHTFCNHNIISNSTFSWWGAYLNAVPGQRIVFPSLWFGIQIKEPCHLYLPFAEVIHNRYSALMFIRALYWCARNFAGDCLRALRR